MTRQQKYPDTMWFHYHNANPKGRITTDCVVRAISTAAELDYDIVALAQALVQIETGYDKGENRGIDILMGKLGWKKMPQPRKPDGTKFTGKEFCEKIAPTAPRIIANIGGGHTVAIIEGKVWDHWDSTCGCIGNYWVKKQKEEKE